MYDFLPNHDGDEIRSHDEDKNPTELHGHDGRIERIDDRNRVGRCHPTNSVLDSRNEEMSGHKKAYMLRRRCNDKKAHLVVAVHTPDARKARRINRHYKEKQGPRHR